MRWARMGAMAAALLAALGCNDALQLNLIVYDPCNQAELKSADHVEVEITGANVSEGVIWSAADGRGSLEQVPPLNDAVISVIGRKANASGGPGDAVVAASIGLVDLTGANGEDVIEISVAIGRTGGFARTTDMTDVRSCTSLAAPRQAHTATLLEDGRVFIAGGFRQNAQSNTFWETTEYFDPKDGSFSTGPAMRWKRRAHTATRLLDGRILIVGGSGPLGDPPQEQTLQVAIVFNPKTEEFEATPRMLEQRANHTATLLDDGRVLVAGGSRQGSEHATTEIFDPITGEFTAGPTLSGPRAFHGAVRIGRSTVALLAGRGGGIVLKGTEFVTAGQAESVVGPDLSVARSHVVAGLVPGQDAIVVAGGFTSVLVEPWFGEGVANVDIIRLNTLRLADSTVDCTDYRLLEARGAASIAPAPGGLLIAGGVGRFFDADSPSEGSEVLASGEFLRFGDLTTCSISSIETVTPLSEPRAAPQLTSLLGGDVLVTGGFAWIGPDLAEPVQRIRSVDAGEIYIRMR